LSHRLDIHWTAKSFVGPTNSLTLPAILQWLRHSFLGADPHLDRPELKLAIPSSTIVVARFSLENVDVGHVPFRDPPMPPIQFAFGQCQCQCQFAQQGTRDTDDPSGQGKGVDSHSTTSLLVVSARTPKSQS
jgi:hypothetical protein